MTPESGSAPPLLELRDVGKDYSSVIALDGITTRVRAGEVTCVLGDNGAGKSTLIKILSGVHRADRGEMLLDGRPVSFGAPREALDAGIATVYQDLATVPLMSVWRNFFLGAEPTRGTWPFRRLDVGRAEEIAAQAMARVGVPGLDPAQPASALQAGERQCLAIARALHFGARVLVVDEPTAPMTIAQRALVLQSVVTARDAGLAVLFVTHSPQYAHLVGDRFLLLGGGRVAGDLTRADVDVDDLTRLVAGGDELTRLGEQLRAAHPDR
jgi:simple sugar transport system ATP-binding protein